MSNHHEEKNSDTYEEATSRKSFLSTLAKTTISLGLLGQGFMFVRSLAPNVLYEPSKRFKLGKPTKFSNGVTYNTEGRLFIQKNGTEYKTISAICTHLGCTVNLFKLSAPKEVTTLSGKTITEEWEFHCPCHGSKYYGDGSVYAGPAPRDLPRWELGIAPDGALQVDTGTEVKKDFSLKV